MWWVAEAPFTKAVTVEWTRRSTTLIDEFEVRPGAHSAPDPRRAVKGRDREEQRDRQVIEGATWTQKAQAHYVSYEDPNADGGRTLTKIEPTQITVLRYGAVQWNQTFREGSDQSSTMHVSGMAIPVRTRTRRLETSVGPAGGSVQIDYVLVLAEQEQNVRLTLKFRA